MGAASSVSLHPALSSEVKTDSDYCLKKMLSEDYSTVIGEFDQWEEYSLGKDTVDDNETISYGNIRKESTFIASLEDLKVKSSYVLSNPTITRVFVRYLFHGMWIADILQIPNLYVSPTLSKAPSSFFHDHCLKENAVNLSMKSLMEDLGKATIFEDASIRAWEKFLRESHRRVNTLLVDPTSTSFAASSISFIELLLPDDKFSVSILTIAVAMQAFCRSDLFMNLSENKWSSESVRTSQWQDYARVGRGLVATYYEGLSHDTSKNQQPVCGLGTVALLDALYVRLLLTSSQTSIFKFLYTTPWLLELDACLRLLPLDIAVLETSNVSTTNTVWSTVSELFYNHDEKSSFLPDEQSCSSANTLQSFLDHLRTSPSPTLFVTANGQACDKTHDLASSKDQDTFRFSAATPVFRSPLLTFSSSTSSPSSSCKESKCVDSLATNQAKDYRWDLHRIVITQMAVSTAGYSLLEDASGDFEVSQDKMRKKLACRSEANVRNVQATIDLSFLIAQIVG